MALNLDKPVTLTWHGINGGLTVGAHYRTGGVTYVVVSAEPVAHGRMGRYAQDRGNGWEAGEQYTRQVVTLRAATTEEISAVADAAAAEQAAKWAKADAERAAYEARKAAECAAVLAAKGL